MNGLPRFRDQASADSENYGFISPYEDQHRLPGQTWAEGNMFNKGSFMPNCNMEDGAFNDTVWQFYGHPDRLQLEQPNDRVFGQIFYSDAVRRLQAVEQLTLPPIYSTIPNTGAFSRFEHIWGSVLFVRQLCNQEGISEEDSIPLQLRTLVSDIAHTTGSHLGDWMFQGMGGAENQHDLELAQYLEATGINKIIRENGIDPDAVTFPETSDWVEASQPDLCVDRVDYGLREMNRWNDVIYSSAYSVKDFTITPDGMLAMQDQQRARKFAEGFLLLSQEHWSEPTHRFMLDMLMLRTKLFYAQGGAPRTWVFNNDFSSNGALVPLHEIHPRDLMYVTDPAQAVAMARPDLGGQILDAIMTSVARYRRQYVWPGRRQRIAAYMGQFSVEGYEDVLKDGTYESLDSTKFDGYSQEYPNALPLGFSIQPVQEKDVAPVPGALDFLQLPLKARQIDPLVRNGTGFKRLSELDPSYAVRLAEHKQHMLQSYIARIAVPDAIAYETITSIVNNVEAAWQARLRSTRRMTAEELASLVSVSGREIFGQYPFLTFLSY